MRPFPRISPAGLVLLSTVFAASLVGAGVAAVPAGAKEGNALVNRPARYRAEVLAGAGDPYGDGGKASAAVLVSPSGLGLVGDDWYVSDEGAGRVWRVDAKTSGIHLVAGPGPDRPLDAGSGLGSPERILVDRTGRTVIPDPTTGRIVEVDPSGSATIVLDPTETDAPGIDRPFAVLDTNDGRFVSDAAGSLWRNDNDGWKKLGVALGSPHGLGNDEDGNIYVADQGAGTVVRLSGVARGATLRSEVIAARDGSAPVVLHTAPEDVTVGDNEIVVVGAPNVLERFARPAPPPTSDDAADTTPDTTAPDTTADTTPDTNTTAPDTTAPDTTAPDTTSPDRAAPPAGAAPRPDVTPTPNNGAVQAERIPADLSYPLAIAIVASGQYVIADSGNHRVVQVADSGKVVRVIAGRPDLKPDDDGGAATRAWLLNPLAVAARPDGSVVFTESGRDLIRVVDKNGRIATLAGTGVQGAAKAGSAAKSRLAGPSWIAAGADGSVLVAEGLTDRLLRIDPSGTLAVFAQNVDTGPIAAAPGGGWIGVGVDSGMVTRYSADGTPGPLVELPEHGRPAGVAVDAKGVIYVTDQDLGAVWRIDSGAPPRRTCGTDTTDGADTIRPAGIVILENGNPAVVERDGGRVLRCTSDGNTPFTNESPAEGDSAGLSLPFAAALRPDGSIVVSEPGTGTLQLVTTGKPAAAFAGTGLLGPQRDGPLNQANFGIVTALAVAGNDIVVADAGAGAIRRISGNTVKTIVGRRGEATVLKPGPAAAANIGRPFGIAVDSTGTTYFSDAKTHQVAQVDASGQLSVLAGTGTSGLSGSGPVAVRAKLSLPGAVSVEPDGSVVVADRDNNRLVRIRTTGAFEVVAPIEDPTGLAVAQDGTIYVSSATKHVVMRIQPKATRAEVVVGTGRDGFRENDGPARSVSLNRPTGLAFDGDRLLIADNEAGKIWVLRPDGRLVTLRVEREGADADAPFAGPVAIVKTPTGIVVADSSNRLYRLVAAKWRAITVAPLF